MGFQKLKCFARYDDKNLDPEMATTLIKTHSRSSSKSSDRSKWSGNRSQLSSLSSNTFDRSSIFSRKPLPLVSVSHGSSSRDERMPKTADARYIPQSFLDSNQTQRKLLSGQTNECDRRYYPGDFWRSFDQKKEPNEQSPPNHQVSSARSHQCDTNSGTPPRSLDGDSSIESSTKNEDSDDRCSVSSADYDRLTIAYTKHQMMVSLMQEVYAMFDLQWKANVRTRVSPTSRSSRSQLEPSDSSNNGSTENCNGKRKNQGREPSPGDNKDNNNNNEKKRRGNPNDGRGSESDPLFACPFQKFDSRKYCPNLDTGIKFRSCSGPGFTSISKLK